MTNDVEQRFKSLGTVSKRFTIPILFWEEWESDCNKRFGGTYASKMQHDHEYHKSMTSMTQLVVQDLITLQEKVLALELQNEEIISELTQYKEREENSSNTEPNVATKGRKTLGEK